MRREAVPRGATRSIDQAFGDLHFWWGSGLNLFNVQEDDMMKGLLALSMAGALVAPQLALASGSRFDVDGERQASISGVLPLPPIPHLDTMPWINLGLEKGPRIDTLLLPDLHLPLVSNISAVANIKQEEAPLRTKA